MSGKADGKSLLEVRGLRARIDDREIQIGRAHV